MNKLIFSSALAALLVLWGSPVAHAKDQTASTDTALIVKEGIQLTKVSDVQFNTLTFPVNYTNQWLSSSNVQPLTVQLSDTTTGAKNDMKLLLSCSNLEGGNQLTPNNFKLTFDMSKLSMQYNQQSHPVKAAHNTPTFTVNGEIQDLLTYTRLGEAGQGIIQWPVESIIVALDQKVPENTYEFALNWQLVDADN